MQSKKIILFAIIFLIISFAGFLIYKNNENLTNKKESFKAQKNVESFENLLENGISADNANSLFNYFSPDVSEQDKIYKNKILEDIKNKKEQVNFKVLSYGISAQQKNESGENHQMLVQEIRNYGDKNNDYGSKFSRVFILEKINNDWKIKEYQKINNNNVYSGILSGSRKYDGFYP